MCLVVIHFLKHLFGSDERCPRSYDKLRFDTSRPGCRLISTHDDYSMVQKLPDGKASVITNLREPVARVLSSYEFSVEVAARFLRHYKTRQTSTESALKDTFPFTHKTRTTRTGLMSTLDIWPWKYLVPFFQKDVFARRDAREAGLLKSTTEVAFNNSYDVESLVMPFREFIHHPVAHELIHNGATFQIAGLTNNSCSPEAKQIRACVVDHQHLGRFVLEVAKRRLDNMLYVGLTDNQKESVEFFANVLRGQLSLQHKISLPRVGNLAVKASTEKNQYGPRNPRRRAAADGKRRFSTQSLQDPVPKNTSLVLIEDVIDELLESYQGCVADLRYTQENRRALSLELIAPINYTKKERKLIPESVIAQVIHLNSLDVELYSHAQLLFAKQQFVLEHGLPDVVLATNNERPSSLDSSEQTDIVQQQEPSLQNMQQSFSVVIGFATVFSLSGLILSIFLLRRKKSLRERTPSRVLHPLFTRVHEKI
ncbi:hypothetical protein AXG93_2899s1260 [Marchantia polymorpha subsp. ruderalis]|uniref:Sulfotransferase n=1 Tax=Marchantia polymorpha subsp. ruderalis TaxID=1480154 RepID=A0A176VC08_MARPO|nr:hypothetical protein AXG93_2899s1260 [Marchantia polymorpha subsp. ruderalis]